MIPAHEIRLPGLEALDPLGFLAALGCLSGVTDRRGSSPDRAPRLSFDTGSMTARLHAELADVDELLDVLCEDLDLIAGRAGEPHDAFLAFRYETNKGKLAHDLKPPPDLFRRVASGHLERASPRDRRTVDWVSAALTDVAVDNNGNCKPFALHFTAGQQQFLGVALELLHGVEGAERRVDRADLNEALLGPWKNERGLKVFSWSPSQDRPYAFRAVDPAGDSKHGTPGADWLALRGLTLLSSAPVGTSISTCGVRGGWKSGTFTYPIWSNPINADAVRALLRHPALQPPGDAAPRRGNVQRTLLPGIEVMTCRITRSDQGGYGAFSRPTRWPM